jgi:hypothetical protein
MVGISWRRVLYKNYCPTKIARTIKKVLLLGKFSLKLPVLKEHYGVEPFVGAPFMLILWEGIAMRK